MKGIIYTRVSSDEQVKGTSLEFQEELCRKYGEQKEIDIVEVFREEGETAKDLSLNNRKKFLEALEFCRKNKNQINAFIVLRVDRFARNTEDHFAIRKILLEYGTTLYSVTEPIGNKPAEKFIETVLAGAAEYDNAIRKQRSSDGMLARINQGIYPWKPPIGYQCLHTKKRGEKKIVPDPPDETTFYIIQKALKAFASGMYQQSQIVLMLRQSGMKTTTGNKPTPQFVDRLLRKHLKFYAGIIHNPWTGEDRTGLHQPMITKEELIKIQAILSGTSKHPIIKHNRLNPEFPLRRTVLCDKCKRPFTGSVSRGNGGSYSYYHCENKECSMYGKSISKKLIEKDFSKYLGDLTLNYRLNTSLHEVVVDRWKERICQHKIEINRNKQLLSILEDKRRRIFEMREDGSYTQNEFKERKEEIERELANALMEQNQALNDDINIEKDLPLVMDFIDSLGSKWLQLPVVQQQRFQKLAFPEGISYKKNEGFGTTKRGHIFCLFQSFSTPHSFRVPPDKIDWNRLTAEVKEWRNLMANFEAQSTTQSLYQNSDDTKQPYRNVA